MFRAAVSAAKDNKAIIELLSASSHDDEFMFSVYASTRADEMNLVDWTTGQKEAFLRMQFNAQRQHYLNYYPSAEYSVIQQAEQSIGRMIIDRSEPTILLIDIALLPEFRNHGIGTTLIQELLKEADDAGRPVQLHVENFNPAMNLYKRFGFVKTAEVSFYLEMTRQPKAVGHV